VPDAPKIPSPARKALDYAEGELGVNAVHEAAQKARDNLDGLVTDLSTKRDLRREKIEKLSDVEMMIAEDERAKHSDMSQAQMDKHIKMVNAKSKPFIELRREIRQLTNEIEGLEYDESIYKVDIQIAVARMTELGGYLNYLGAARLGVIQQKVREDLNALAVKFSTENWPPTPQA
jgi:hypothetical protein